MSIVRASDMAVAREHAVKIAREYLQSRMAGGSARFDGPVSVRREDARKGGTSHWSVMFERVEPPGVVLSPGEVIVHVDEETGHPEVFRTP
jgi:hypothetical protein